MVSRVWSIGLLGVGGYSLSAECDLSAGLPGFDIVGLPDTAVKESRERVRAAIKNLGYEFPMRRVTVNLAPADTRKAGPIYDLPIALAILCASGQLDGLPPKSAFIGELGLDGSLRGIAGALPIAISAGQFGYTSLFVPRDNADEAALAGNVNIYAADTVADIIGHLRGKAEIYPTPAREVRPDGDLSGFDFAEVRGQENAKRALEIAAAGGHNILMFGPPGTGKSMLAKRLFTILPDMSHEEMLQSTKIYSVAGMTNREHPLVHTRPFRSPHHTISEVGLAGGGVNPHPGEISLAHNGVLFLDELPEFDRNTIEVLRQPLEDGQVTISRASGTLTFPARFMLVCAMNPCRCGWYGTNSGRCTCSPASILSYAGRISGPLLDRIDICVDLPPVTFDEMSGERGGEPSSVIKERVNEARRRQRARFPGEGTGCNAHMTAGMIERHCALGEQQRSMLNAAFDRFNMSARAFNRILKVARTIADLDGAQDIGTRHLGEALQYRNLHRKE